MYTTLCSPLLVPPHLCGSLGLASNAAAAQIDDDVIEQLLRKYQSKFISVVDAHAIVDELCQEKIIDEDLAERIRKETAKNADGGHL